MGRSAADLQDRRVDLAQATDFELGGLCIRPSRREVEFKGERRDLEPKVAQVLVALAAARPKVVSREQLIEQCWDGRIVGDDALNRCIVSLRQLARNFSPEPFAIETVPRVGYSLLERQTEEVRSARASPIWKKPAVATALVFILFVAALAAGWSWLSPRENEPASIAVLPFRNLSTGHPYFAEGVGEEIMIQLLREPQFRVAGGASSSQFGDNVDPREIGRRLDVDYLLQGSVRTQGERVRVNAELIRARDSARLWSESYDGGADDIFAIQQQIGGSIAAALRRKLVRVQPLTGALVTNGEVYNLYLTARGLIRTYNRRLGGTAADLLRDAIALDADYAPAWSALAAATQMDGALKGTDGFIAATEEAQGYARQALRLAPDFAEAHRTLGLLLGYGTPEAQAHLRRAAQLEPGHAENLIWLGVAHGAAGEFEKEIAAYRRAVELDPLWFRTVGALSVAVAEMGDRAEAERIAESGFAGNPISRQLALGRVAWVFGDFSRAAQLWSGVERANSPRWSDTARRHVDDALFAAGVPSGTLVAVPAPNDQRRLTPVWIEAAPTPAAWLASNRNRIAGEVNRERNHKAAKLMLNTGRARELVAVYGSSAGILGLGPGRALRVDQLHEVPVVALALRRGGRRGEADLLLAAADRLLRTVYARGRVPFRFDADAARLRAVQGRRDEAISILERAIRRGWTHNANTDLRDLADEPAFRELRAHPRFERVQARLQTHQARERAEAAGMARSR